MRWRATVAGCALIVMTAVTAAISADQSAELTMSSDSIEVVVRCRAGVDPSTFLEDALVSPMVGPLGTRVAVGRVRADVLSRLSLLPGVVTVRPAHELLKPPTLDSKAAGRGSGREAAHKSWFAVGDAHRSQAAWAKGYTGSGVRVMINDSGIDFCHPDLYGTWAIVEDPASPYHGWPMMFDGYSMYLLARDVDLGESNVAEGGTDYADTSATCTAGAPCTYQPIGAQVTHTFTLTGTSRSGLYHIGSHPDRFFEQPQAYGERLAILLVDEATPSVYDTVYVDLNHNLDFSDEVPVTREQPAACGTAAWGAVSGGLVYFIADGVNPVPASDWSWNLAAPANGSLVAFSLIDVTEPAAFHGQFVASNIAGQGIVTGNPGYLAEDVGWVRGAGRDARLVSSGNFWTAATVEDAFFFAALGYDGIAGTGDEIQIVSNSWNVEPGLENDGWDQMSRMIEEIQHQWAPQMSILFSAGNSGSGFGSRVAPVPPSSIGVGSSTIFGAVELDSASSAEQITHGDLAFFSGRGPGALGEVGVHILAAGDHQAGMMPVNMQGPGWIAGGGTSVSCPVAAGNLTLVYDAYRQAHGVWPSHRIARALLMAGARSNNSDPLAAGSGVIDAERATTIAGHEGGVYVLPDTWRPGDLAGTTHPAFSNIVFAGHRSSTVLTLFNTATSSRSVNLRGERLRKGSEHTFEWTTSQVDEEAEYNTNRPDYLRDITELAEGAPELMVIRAILPFSEFDADGDSVSDSHWRVLVYDWTDADGDGALWHDDGDGVVEEGELDAGEYVRLAFSGNEGTAHEVRVHNPHQRHRDGLFLGLQHEARAESVPVTHLGVRVELFLWQPWDWIDLVPEAVTIPGHGATTLVAHMKVPEGTAPGLYQGRILVDSGSWSSTVPVTANVAARLENETVVLGGSAAADPAALYNNGAVRGLFRWSDRNEYGGDRRLFFVETPAGERPGSRLVMRTAWQGQTPATDIDTIILGPAEDDPSTTDPDHFGPYTLTIVGRSEDTYQGAGVWRFATSTGGPEDLIEAPLVSGLYAIAVHNVLYAGDRFETPFTITLQAQRSAPEPRRPSGRVSR